jgi:hypothetical protein
MQRRSFAREAVRWKTEVALASAQSLGEVRDISAVGAFVVPSQGEQLAEGQRLRLRIHLPWDRELLEVEATVRWQGMSREHRCEGFGVLFDEAQPRIAAYLDDSLGDLPMSPGRDPNPRH